jgi:hypothetical protein
MNLAAAIAWGFAVVVVVASARLLWRDSRNEARDRPRAWRTIVLLVAQAASAVLLYCALFPPEEDGEAGTLVVLTAAADRAQWTNRPPGVHLVAMPEAPILHEAERMPDLANALRRYPATTRLRVVGAGLVARDREAAQGHALDFMPAPLPRGLVALWPPRRVQAGRPFEVGGLVEGLQGGSVELLDPGNAVVARATIGAEGRFRLAGTARDAGLATWRLRLRDKDKARIEDTALPLATEAGAPLRVLLLAGAPNPELKYLRRWATDAGLRIETRISLGAGMQIGDAPAAFDAASLGKLDLVVLDQRSWQALGAARRATLDAAVRDGLGLLLRLPDALSGNDRTALRRLGFVATAGAAGEARLPAAPSVTGDTDGDAAPSLTRAPLRIDAIDGSALLGDAKGTPLASWRARGAGRIGIATFDDSFRLVLAGHADRHGALWSSLFSILARAGAASDPAVAGDPRAGERITLCGLHDRASVDAPDGRRTTLLIDPASGRGACAGFWPRLPGWHVLREPAPAQAGSERRVPFHVRAATDAPGLRAAGLREATQRLAAADATATTKKATTASVPGPRWPWFLAWLLLASALWWFERSRAGTSTNASASAR